MLKEQLKLLKNAYECYFSDQREDIDKKILTYVKKIINENEDIIKKLIELYEEKFGLEDIYRTIDETLNSEDIYKAKKVYKKRDDGFVHGKYTTSIGIIAIECSDTLKVLKYFAESIKSRNAIAISDIEFDETSLKSAFLVFFCEALEKFDLDKNLLMLLPFEECYYEKFDRAIYADSQEVKVKSRKNKDVLYIFLEDKFFEEEAKKEVERLKKLGKDYYVLAGEFDKVVNKINETFNKGAVIYTRNAELGYKFINLVHSENVFINTTLEEIEDIEIIENPFYMNKNIMYQLDRNISYTIAQEDRKGNEKVEKIFENENKNNEIKIEAIKLEKRDISKEDNSLIVQEENIWYKRIIRKIKELFKKF